jgi:UDP-glucuronate decarboxylase
MATGDEVTGPMNLGNPVEIRVDELARLVVQLTGSRSTIEFRGLPSDDPKQRRPDISLARATLGWQPAVALESGLQRTIAYFESRLGCGGAA